MRVRCNFLMTISIDAGNEALSEKVFLTGASIAHDSVVVYPVNADGVFDGSSTNLLGGGIFAIKDKLSGLTSPRNRRLT